MEIDEGTLLSWDELLAKIKESKSKTFNNGSDVFNIDTYKEQIDSFQSTISTLSSALEKIRSGNLTDTDVLNLKKEFKELSGVSEISEQSIINLINNALRELLSLLGENVPSDLKDALDGTAESARNAGISLSESFSSIQKSYDALQDFKDAMKDGMTDDALSSVASLSNELESLVAGYYAGAVSAEELYNALSSYYGNELKNYSNALIAKNQCSEEFYNALGLADQKVVDSIAENYGIDLSNCKSYAQAKFKIEQQTTQQMAKLWAKLYGGQAKYSDLAYDALASAYYTANGTGLSEESKRAFEQMRALKQNAADAYNALNNITYERIDANFDKISSMTASNSGGDSQTSSAKDTSKDYDLIEISIKNIEKAISDLDGTLSSSYLTWGKRNNALIQEISEINKEIDIQQKGYNKYMHLANSVGLSGYYQDLIKNGRIDIITVTDEKLQEQIDEFQQWYDKATECQEAVKNLKSDIAGLAMTGFKNITSEYDDKISQIGHAAEMLDGYISQIEERGYLSSRNYYHSLIETEKENIRVLQEEYSALSSSMDGVEKYSEDWYEMADSLNSVEKAMQDANTSLIEYQNSIRQLDWDRFDKMEDYISKLQDESDFLIELLADNDLFNDNGQFNESGNATLGLHAVNLDAYMSQADDYAKQLLEIDRELANDPYNTKLIERRQELLGLQQDMVSAAEDEKMAMKDLVSESYDAMLGALQKLIDKRKEALNSQKDLYDYQKNIAEQTKGISSLEKQLQAYAGDMSEESRATIQQLKVSLEEARTNLEETEYDKFISDQEKLMDDLYAETEEWLNTRLDDLDSLVQGVIDATNANSGSISETIKSEAESIGYNISAEMDKIWGNTSNSVNGVTQVVAAYTENFNSHSANVLAALNGIRDLLASAQGKSDDIAKGNSAAVKAPVAASPSPTPSVGSNTSSPAPSTVNPGSGGSPSGSGSNSGWGNWFIKKLFGGNKGTLSKEVSIVDRLKYFDFDSSLLDGILNGAATAQSLQIKISI